jgi:RNA polymerase sigma-70 factor (ECF subfamily)
MDVRLTVKRWRKGEMRPATPSLRADTRSEPRFRREALCQIGAAASMAIMGRKRGSARGPTAATVVDEAVGRTDDQLSRMARGSAEARSAVFARLYSHLHRIASRVRRGNAAASLETTDLIGEAYERLVEEPEGGWRGREHFLARAAIAMRQVLIDHLRAQAARKRGGGSRQEAGTDLDQVVARLEDRTGGLLRFDAALGRLRREHPRSAQVVDLRVFAELTVKEVASVLDVSPRSVEREWTFAKAWLKTVLG